MKAPLVSARLDKNLGNIDGKIESQSETFVFGFIQAL